MLLHLSSENLEIGQAIVGQFHSGRVVPILLTSLGLMLNGMILPYLSADWEAGRLDRVCACLKSTFSMIALSFWILSMAGLVVASWLFHEVLDGRYADGMAIMPMAMVHCILMALALFLHTYLWCAERGQIIACLVGCGLILNIGLNIVLVPRYGVHGAMLSTLLAGGMILSATIYILQKAGCWIGLKNIALALLPITMLISIDFSFCCFALSLLVISRTDWLLCVEDKQAIESQLKPICNRLGLADLVIWRS